MNDVRDRKEEVAAKATESDLQVDEQFTAEILSMIYAGKSSTSVFLQAFTIILMQVVPILYVSYDDNIFGDWTQQFPERFHPSVGGIGRCTESQYFGKGSE